MSYPAYTSSRISQLAQLWSSLTGLDYSVAQAQITAEQGVNGNVVGLTVDNGSATKVYPGQTGVVQASNGQWLATFGTQEAGLQAAAWWLKSPSSPYATVRNAISTGNAAIQAHALANSGWAGAGGYRSSDAFSSLLSASPGPGTGTTPTPSPSSKPLSPLDILQIAGTGNPLDPLIAAAQQAQQAAAAATSVPQALAALPGNLASAAAPLVIGLVVLVLVAWLVIAGVREVMPAA